MLLPGGHAVLFHAFGDAAGDRVAVLDLDTGEEKTVVEGGSNPAYVDTGHLVFARGDTLMAVPFKASELAVTGEPVALVQGIRRASGGAADYALSANGTLAYVPGTRRGGIRLSAVVWVDRTGKVIGRAVPDLVANPRDPRLSPDGKRLLLVTGPVQRRGPLELRLERPAADPARVAERQPLPGLEPGRQAGRVSSFAIRAP